jgi:type II secretory pathway predicted ATPase ExeA
MLSRHGFHEMPFTRELSVKDRFSHPQFEEAREALHEAVRARMCAALIAPAGCGKTTLIRCLEDELPQARYDTRYTDVTSLGKRDMCREVALAVGAQPAGRYPGLVRAIKERFTNRTEVDGLRPVLIVDNSHELRPDVLGVLRVLTNFARDSKLVVSILLVGQPPLLQVLRRAELEDVHGRLTHLAQLGPLSRTEVKKYIEHRCAIAGASTVPFDADSLDGVYEIARGNMRAIDRLCRKALLLAHAQGADRVDSNHVTAARKVLWP